LALRVCLGVLPLSFKGIMTACAPSASSLPGTSEGAFAVVGSLGENTCGSRLSPSNPWDFTLDLSKDGSTLYAQDEASDSELSGTLSANTATVSAAATSNVDGTEAGAGTCNLTQTTSLTISLDSASSPSSFTGSATYTFSVATSVSSNTDCTDQLVSSGGTYATLPCTVNYSLSAKRK
jgi:hypothetical protein